MCETRRENVIRAVPCRGGSFLRTPEDPRGSVSRVYSAMILLVVDCLGRDTFVTSSTLLVAASFVMHIYLLHTCWLHGAPKDLILRSAFHSSFSLLA